MSLFSSLAKNFLNSFIFTCIISLIGLSFMVGDFPPKPSQIQSTFNQYKNLLKMKEQLMNENNELSNEELVVLLEQGKKRSSLKNRESATQFPSYQDYIEQLDQIGIEHVQNEAQNVTNPESGGRIVRDPASGEVLAQPLPPSKVELPREVQEQIYQLKSEVFRLNQKVIELEREKSVNHQKR